MRYMKGCMKRRCVEVYEVERRITSRQYSYYTCSCTQEDGSKEAPPHAAKKGRSRSKISDLTVRDHTVNLRDGSRYPGMYRIRAWFHGCAEREPWLADYI